MSDDILPVGKLPLELMSRLFARSRPEADLLLGPAVGEDAGAVAVPGGVLVAAADPVTLTSREIARHAVIVNANDIAVTGARPRWFLATVLLPPGSTAGEVERIFEDLHDSLAQLGASLLGGHTEVTDAVVRPVVAGQMLGMADDGPIVRTGGLEPGDVVVQVGRAPIEGAAVLANEAREQLGGLSDEVLAEAMAAVRDPGISVVDAALLSAALGAKSLHDPTEGGLAAGLHELAAASGMAIRVDPSAVLWFEPGRSICAALGADPWGTLASGALLAGFAPSHASQVAARLRAHGYEAAEIGRAEPGAGVLDAASGDPLPWPQRDEVTRVLSSPSGTPREAPD